MHVSLLTYQLFLDFCRKVYRIKTIFKFLLSLLLPAWWRALQQYWVLPVILVLLSAGADGRSDANVLIDALTPVAGTCPGLRFLCSYTATTATWAHGHFTPFWKILLNGFKNTVWFSSTVNCAVVLQIAEILQYAHGSMWMAQCIVIHGSLERN